MGRGLYHVRQGRVVVVGVEVGFYGKDHKMSRGGAVRRVLQTQGA